MLFQFLPHCCIPVYLQLRWNPPVCASFWEDSFSSAILPHLTPGGKQQHLWERRSLCPIKQKDRAEKRSIIEEDIKVSCLSNWEGKFARKPKEPAWKEKTTLARCVVAHSLGDVRAVGSGRHVCIKPWESGAGGGAFLVTPFMLSWFQLAPLSQKYLWRDILPSRIIDRSIQLLGMVVLQADMLFMKPSLLNYSWKHVCVKNPTLTSAFTSPSYKACVHRHTGTHIHIHTVFTHVELWVNSFNQCWRLFYKILKDDINETSW